MTFMAQMTLPLPILPIDYGNGVPSMESRVTLLHERTLTNITETLPLYHLAFLLLKCSLTI